MGRLTYSEVEGIRRDLRKDLDYMIPEWELASLFVAPQRLRRDPSKKAHKRNDHKIVKNQAGRSLRTFVSGMMNGATPKYRPWFNQTVNHPTKGKTGSARKYLSAADMVINDHLQVSNFYRVLPLAYKDVGVFSNSAFAMLPHPRYVFYFYPFAVGTYSFACDAEGNTNMFTRDFSLTVRQVVEQYGVLDKNGKPDFRNIPKWVEEHYRAARYLEPVVLSMVLLPNPSFTPGPKLDPADKKFQCYTFVMSMGTAGIPAQSSSGFRNEQQTGEKEPFLKVSGYDYFPVITPRWEVQAEENFGVDGPTQIALSDVMTLQEMEKFRMEATAKMVKPPMVGHSSLRRHQSSILAGGITYVDDAGAQAGFKPAFELDARLADLIADQHEYVDAIRSAYYEDLFLMLSGGETKTHVTAREIDLKEGERMSALAPAMGQWDQDLCSKVIYNARFLLEEKGRMPEIPRELRGEQFRPEYVSVLAEASKVSMMNSIERLSNYTVSMAAAHQDPSLLKLVKAETMIRKYADYVAVDPAIVTDEDEFQEVRNQAAAMQQQQLMMQQKTQEAAVAKDLSAAKIGEGSMLDTLLSASGA